MPTRAVVPGLVLLSLAVLGGCRDRSPVGPAEPQPAGDAVAAETAAPAEPQATRATHVTRGPTPYYLASPAQARPPEGTWPADTRVRLVESAGAYARVTAPDGTTAWVASASLRPIAANSP